MCFSKLCSVDFLHSVAPVHDLNEGGTNKLTVYASLIGRYFHHTAVMTHHVLRQFATHIVMAVMMTAGTLTAGTLTAAAAVITTEALASANCWSNSNATDVCIIQATLYTLPPNDDGEGEDYGLPLDIDCTDYNETIIKSNDDDDDVAPRSYMENRSAHKAHVQLDGCHTPLAASTYGLEYLHNCAEISSLLIKRFQGDATLDLNCGNNDIEKDFQVSALYFRHNDIATIGSSTFAHLKGLQHLQFEANSLRYVECLKLPKDLSLQSLSFRQEKLLALKNASLFTHLDVHTLELVSLKFIVQNLFKELPTKLISLIVANTSVEDNKVILVNPMQLKNISIIDCALIEFHLSEQKSIVQHLNLAKNALKAFSVESSVELGQSNLLDLDMSENGLVFLEKDWFKNLKSLQKLHLHGNLFKTLSLPLLLKLSKSIEFIDLRDNRLTKLSDTDSRVECELTRIQIDRNPWSCMWLLKFAHTQPEKFRLFQYDKYISQINVNGLTCQSLEAEIVDEIEVKQHIPKSNYIDRNGIERQVVVLNVTEMPTSSSNYTIIYGDLAYEVKRNQKAEALIIVFMLPVGIALLFLLLYMWLHCQKVFHLSYYRNIPQMGWCKSNNSNNPPTCFHERFDVVRFPVGNTQANGDINYGLNNGCDDGYETPINSQPSICNCQNMLMECQKTCHVTYEALPEENAYQVYSEIKENDDDSSPEDEDGNVALGKQITPTAPIYDHLSFIEITEQQQIVDNAESS